MDDGTAKGREPEDGAPAAEQPQPQAAAAAGHAPDGDTADGRHEAGGEHAPYLETVAVGGPWSVTERAERPAAVLGTALAAVAFLGVVAILLGLLVWRGGTGFGPTTVSGPVAGRQVAAFELDDGVGAVRMRAAPLGEDLYRVTVPAGHGLSPQVGREGGNVRLNLEPTGQGGRGLVDVALNAGVAWTLRVNGGTRHTVIDMTGGKLDGVELAGGSGQVEMTLPAPSRVVTIRLASGVDQVVVRLPAGTPVRVGFAAGAGRVSLDGTSRHGIAPGQSFTANGFGETNTGVDIQAGAGVGSLSISQF